MEKRRVNIWQVKTVLNDKRSKGMQIYATTVRGNILNIKTKRILIVLIR